MSAPDKKAEAIRQLTAAGYVLFPLSGTSKIPRKDFPWRAVKPGQYDEKTLASSNYAIALGENDLVIDVDPRNFGAVMPDGQVIVRMRKTAEGQLVVRDEAVGLPVDNPLKRLADAVGVPFDTFTVKTGSGGYHLFFRVSLAEGLVIVANLTKQGFIGIDSKHHGGYVVGPGSTHPDTGGVYQIVRKSPAAVAPAAEKLVALVTRPAEDSLNVQGTGEFIDDEQTRKRYADYLEKKAPPSIQGQGGDANAFVVAARGRDFALPPEATLQLLMEVWNERCQPPWTESELREKVRHAYRYAASPIGNAHPLAGLADFQADPLDAEEQVPPSFGPVPEMGIPYPPTLPPALVALAELPGALDSEPQPKLPGATRGDVDSPHAQGSADVSMDDVDWAMSANGTVLKNFQNLINYLKAKTGTGLTGIFGFNEFTCQVEFVSPAPWHRGKMPHGGALTDADLKLLKAHLAVRHTFERSVSEVEEAVTVVAWGKRFHPVREYLDGLEWDGVPRLDFWLRDHLGVEETAYTRAVARKVLCAAVVRVFRPGCKFDHVLVLEGDQDIGKSTALEILGGEWAADFPVDPHNKDTVQLLQGKWIVELAEMEVTGRTETDALKAFLTRKSDKVRLAYGRLAVEYPRQSIFVASKNPGADGTYLKDDTGNRRWWPVMCKPEGGIVNFRKLKDARNQLWAEAVARVRAPGGERLDMDTAELKNEAKAVVALRHAEHPWVERVAGWLESLRPQRDFVTAREVFIDALQGIDKQLDPRTSSSIGRALKTLGWRPDVRRRNGVGRPMRGYSLIETRTPQQIADDLNKASKETGIEDFPALDDLGDLV